MKSSTLRMGDDKPAPFGDILRFLRTRAIRLAEFALNKTGTSYLFEPSEIKVECVRLKLKRLAPAFSGIRIAQVSDIHMGGWMNAERLQRVADLVVEQAPNLALFTGDYLPGHVFNEQVEQSVRELIAILTPLAASIPTFGILGNHDYWTNHRAVHNMLRECGIIELTNSVYTISRNGANLHICGVDDVWEGDVRLQDILDQLPDGGAAILLAHEPDFADESAATSRFDLQVSGHSHGGQVSLPFFGPPILPYLGRKYPSGLYKVGEMYQYTNRGVGTGRLAVRFNCPPEITIFELIAGGDG